MSDTTIHEDGLYFGMPEAEYHADRALGSSDLKLLAGEPADYWHERLNPLRPADSGNTPSKALGRAVHKLVLEGAAEFGLRYECEPDPEGLCVTVADIKSRLIEFGVPPKGKVKADKIKQLLGVDPDARILDVIKGNAAAAGRTILNAEDYDRVVNAAQQMAANPALREAFVGGYSEVSVFWTESRHGVEIRRKARFDFLKPRAIVDLKSIRRASSAPFPVDCRKAIAGFSYDVQAAAYLDARAMAKQFALEGRVHAAEPPLYMPDPLFLNQLARVDEFAFVFVFWRSQGAPLTWGCQLSPGSPILEMARSMITVALNNYMRYVTKFGVEQPWIEAQPLQELAIEEMPAWYGRAA